MSGTLTNSDFQQIEKATLHASYLTALRIARQRKTRSNGLTTAQIAREIDKSWDSVSRYITKRDKYGSKNSTGWPAKLSQRSKRYIKKLLDNDVTKLTDIQRCLEMHDTVKVSERRSGTMFSFLNTLNGKNASKNFTRTPP